VLVHFGGGRGVRAEFSRRRAGARDLELRSENGRESDVFVDPDLRIAA
jgi:hypothetical protein